MKKFVILLKRIGDGCNYSICCGKDYLFIEAKDMEEALYNVRKYINDNCFGDNRLETVYILPANEIVNALYTISEKEKTEKLEMEVKQKKEAEEAKIQAKKELEEKERMEFERLKLKFQQS